MSRLDTLGFSAWNTVGGAFDLYFIVIAGFCPGRVVRTEEGYYVALQGDGDVSRAGIVCNDKVSAGEKGF